MKQEDKTNKMKKINIAELLKDCPKGMELDCTIYDDVTFNRLQGNEYIIINRGYNGGEVHLTKFGQIYNSNDAKCVIFPKDKTTWEGFYRPFKDGDILTTTAGSIFIYKKTDAYNLCAAYVALDIRKGFLPTYNSYPEECSRLATEEEKAKLFQAIKDNGYHWNDETKTFKRLFPYNIGTKVWVKSDKEHKYIHTIVGISHNSCGNLEYEVKEDKTGVIVHYPKDLLIPITTKEPKFKVGDRVKHISAYVSGIVVKVDNKGYCIDYPKGEGLCYISFELEKDYELAPNKFDINTLKPFDKVLVRMDNGFWRIGFFEKIEKKDKRHPLVCMTYNRYSQCIPYKGNEHLLGTTDNCDDFYKTWEE